VKKLIRRLLSAIAIAYASLAILLYAYQRDLLYFPTAAVEHSFSTIDVHNEGETLNIIVLNPGKKEAVLAFGGNSEAVVNQANEHMADFPNQTIYLANYRGYGKSTGKPSEQALYSDALAVFDRISQTHERVSIMGRSLGSGVASYVAVNRIIDRLILITPYDSIEAVAQTQYPIFPISLLIKDTFDSVGRAPDINAPTLILVAEQDAVVPRENTLNLVRAFTPDKLKVKAFKNAGHNDISHLDEYHAAIKAFMQ